MIIRLATFIVVCAGIAVAPVEAQDSKSQKNLIRNGGFTEGIKYWRGDGKVEVFKSEPAGTEETSDTPPPPVAATPTPKRPPFGATAGKQPGADEDRSICVTLGSRSQTFYQSVTVPRKAKGLKVSFRARTAPGFLTSRSSLGPFQIRLIRSDEGSTYNDKKLEAKPGWQMITDEFPLKEYSRTVNVQIEVFPGTGQLYFDDFVVEAL